MSEVVIASAVRTPIGTFMGALSTVPATRLGEIAVVEAACRAGIASEGVDEVVMGNLFQAGLGQHPARRSALAAGDARVAVAGGTDNMSVAPPP